jgi:hypothetical protein
MIRWLGQLQPIAPLLRVVAPTTCPSGQRWDAATRRCVSATPALVLRFRIDGVLQTRSHVIPLGAPLSIRLSTEPSRVRVLIGTQAIREFAALDVFPPRRLELCWTTTEQPPRELGCRQVIPSTI